MKKFLTITIASCLIAAASGTGLKAQDNGAFQSFIEVNGYAEKEVAPDIFYLRINIDEQDTKGKKSLEQQQKSMLNVLKSSGIDTEKQLVRLSLSSSFHNRKTNMATASYQLKLNSADDVSRIWQKLDALGLSDISFVKAEYSLIDELKDEVRQLAVKNARQQAESMAGAIDQSIGKCFYIYCGYSGNSAVYAQPRVLTKAAFSDSMNEMAVEEESIEFDNIKVSINVSTKFVLE